MEPWLRQKFVLMSAELEFSLRFHVHVFFFWTDHQLKLDMDQPYTHLKFNSSPLNIYRPKRKVVHFSGAEHDPWPGEVPPQLLPRKPRFGGCRRRISMARVDVNLKPLKTTLVASVLEVFLRSAFIGLHWHSSGGFFKQFRGCPPQSVAKMTPHNIQKTHSPWKKRACSLLPRWWFQIFYMFTPIWGNDPFWLIFFSYLSIPLGHTVKRPTKPAMVAGWYAWFSLRTKVLRISPSAFLQWMDHRWRLWIMTQSWQS